MILSHGARWHDIVVFNVDNWVDSQWRWHFGLWLTTRRIVHVNTQNKKKLIYRGVLYFYINKDMILCYLYDLFLGCYRLSGIPKALHSISHCYKRCSNLHHNAFEHFAFKVKQFLFTVIVILYNKINI